MIFLLIMCLIDFYHKAKAFLTELYELKKYLLKANFQTRINAKRYLLTTYPKPAEKLKTEKEIRKQRILWILVLNTLICFYLN